MTLSWKTTGWLLFAGIAVFSALFLTFPEIDLWASSFFYKEDGGFWMRSNPVFDAIRYFLIDGLTVLVLLTFAMTSGSAIIGKRRVISLNVWAFLSVTFLIGPLLLVNGILKAYWGRARPTYVEYFGGEATFTPPLVMTDQCASNCSFVSGEGSAIATTLIVLWVVLWPNLKGLWRHLGLWLVVPFMSFGIALRVITGRHFLSDTIFAILFCGVVAWGFYRVFNMRDHRHDLTWANLRRDFLKK